MPPTVRAFLALELGGELRTALAALQERLRRLMPPDAVRWSRAEQLHLTLRFLGNVPPDRLEPLIAALRPACAARPLHLSLEGLGCFPSPARPRVLWVGIRGDLAALRQLAQRLAAAAQGFGDHAEEREFAPHLTLGRLNERGGRCARAVGAVALAADPGRLGEWTAGEVLLMRSELGAGGARHAKLASFLL